MGSLLTSAINQNPDKSILNQLKSKFQLEALVDIIDEIDDSLEEDDVYLPLSVLKEKFSKYLNQLLIEKVYTLMVDKSEEQEHILKFELFCLFILLCKGSFEAKINSIGVNNI
jgi:hypothetical protein